MPQGGRAIRRLVLALLQSDRVTAQDLARGHGWSPLPPEALRPKQGCAQVMWFWQLAAGR